jgi:hypothetical protein
MSKTAKEKTKNKTPRGTTKRKPSPNKPTQPDRITGKKKPEEFRQYGLFMALPQEERKEIFGFTTDKQFAAHFKVNPGTLSEWKWEEDLWSIRDQYLIVFKKHTADIIASLAKRAKRTGEAFHTLSFLKVVEGFTEKNAVDFTSKGRKISGFEVVIKHASHAPTSSRDKKPEAK